MAKELLLAFLYQSYAAIDYSSCQKFSYSNVLCLPTCVSGSFNSLACVAAEKNKCQQLCSNSNQLYIIKTLLCEKLQLTLLKTNWHLGGLGMPHFRQTRSLRHGGRDGGLYNICIVQWSTYIKRKYIQYSNMHSLRIKYISQIGTLTMSQVL